MKSRPLRALIPAAAVAAAGLFLISCATPGPPGRIERYPDMYAALPPATQQAVREGRIQEGMSKDAVYLAWGKPDVVTMGSQSGVSFEHWRYTALQPIYHSNLTMGYGFGYRGYYGRHYSPAYFAYDTGPDYVPVTAAVVRFKNDRVVSWERAR